MTETLLITLAVSQVIVLFFICMPYYGKVMIELGLRKNSGWITEHPEFTRHKLLEKFHSYFHYVLGVVTSVMIINYVWISPGTVHFLWLLLVPLGVSLSAFLLFTAALQRLVIKTIPAPDRIKASLDDRRLSSLVPMWVVYLGVACLFILFGIYSGAIVTEVINIEIATERLIGLSGFIVLWVGILIYTVKRKHSEMELIFKENGRKYELWQIVVTLYLGVFVGIWRILGDFYGINLFSDNSFFIVGGFSVQLLLLHGYFKIKGNPETLGRKEKYG